MLKTADRSATPEGDTCGLLSEPLSILRAQSKVLEKILCS